MHKYGDSNNIFCRPTAYSPREISSTGTPQGGTWTRTSWNFTRCPTRIFACHRNQARICKEYGRTNSNLFYPWLFIFPQASFISRKVATSPQPRPFAPRCAPQCPLLTQKGNSMNCGPSSIRLGRSCMVCIPISSCGRNRLSRVTLAVFIQQKLILLRHIL